MEKGLYKEKFTKVGAKPYDCVLMFKFVVLQRIYHLSDPQAKYQIRDRRSFRDFLGMASGDRVPDEKTILAFKEELTKKGLFEEDRGGELWNPEDGDTEEEKKRKANKKRQKDTDARWVKKGGEKHYGYKNHTKVDKWSKYYVLE